jgi:hypothetical protein
MSKKTVFYYNPLAIDTIIANNSPGNSTDVLTSNGSAIYWSAGGAGAPGYTGSQGPIGYTGSQGNIGYTGSQGNIGFTGSQGVIGYSGSLGYTGSQGNIGYTGSKGDIGVTGFTGSQGTQGVIGYTGSQGTTGATGFTGSQGVIGYTGSQGTAGSTGFTGSQGSIGYTGSQGTTGFTGSQGTTGFTGSQGTTGFTGSQGDKGGLRYNFSTTTTAGTTANGDLRYNNATIASVTNLYINYNDVNAIALNAFIAQWSASTNGNRGQLLIKDNSNSVSRVNVFNITGAVTDNSTYYTIPVSFVSGTLPTSAENLVIQFVRTGDIGYTGSQGTTGFTGSQGSIGYTGSGGSAGSIGYTGSSGSSLYWTEGKNTSAPNATVPAISWTPNSSETNIDAVILPKGNGALLGAIPDNTATGGNKRGTYSVDLQFTRDANTQVAAGSHAVLIGGGSSTANGTNSIVAGGIYHNANADYSGIFAGWNNFALGTYSVVLGGSNCIALGQYSVVKGQGTQDKSRSYAETFGSPCSGTNGQRGTYLLGIKTLSNTANTLTIDGAAISGSNRIALSNYESYKFTIDVHGTLANNAGTGSAAFRFEGVIEQFTGTVRFVNTPAKTIYCRDVASWDCTIYANTSQQTLDISVTGSTSNVIHWMAKVELTELDMLQG